jgi:hypothetical protein
MPEQRLARRFAKCTHAEIRGNFFPRSIEKFRLATSTRTSGELVAGGMEALQLAAQQRAGYARFS